MATGYEAIVRARAEGVPAIREHGIRGLLRQELPAEAIIEQQRDGGDGLMWTVRFMLEGEDASQAQVRARELTQQALQHAGLAEEAVVLDDAAVKSTI